jgi:hypothetical protein
MSIVHWPNLENWPMAHHEEKTRAGSACVWALFFVAKKRAGRALAMGPW